MSPTDVLDRVYKLRNLYTSCIAKYVHNCPCITDAWTTLYTVNVCITQTTGYIFTLWAIKALLNGCLYETIKVNIWCGTFALGVAYSGATGTVAQLVEWRNWWSGVAVSKKR